jgi:hypothetical protein
MSTCIERQLERGRVVRAAVEYVVEHYLVTDDEVLLEILEAVKPQLLCSLREVKAAVVSLRVGLLPLTTESEFRCYALPGSEAAREWADWSIFVPFDEQLHDQQEVHT